jgi:hypothetical protein
MGARAGLVDMEKEKISFLYRDSNLDSLVVQPIAWSPYRLR